MPGEIFVAKDGACISTPQGDIFIVAGKTTVRAGHPIHQSHPHLWEPMKVDFEVTPLPPPPGRVKDDEEEPPVVRSASPRTQGARARA